MSAYIWQPRPVGSRSLTAEAVKWALYCCAPVGIGQLTQHLHARGYEFEEADLSRHLSAYKGLRGIEHQMPGGRTTVKLIAIPGHGI